MHLGRFFRVTWTLQLLVGVALFSVSFLIEGSILAAFFGATLIAWTLAVALEVGKAAAIAFHRHLHQSQEAAYPLSVRAISAAFRIGLIGLSLVCSLLFLGVQLDRPHVQALRDQANAEFDALLAQDLARLDAERRTRTEAHRQSQADALAAARAEHQRRILDLETRLAAEMENVVGGVFKGPRYYELAARLADAKAEGEHALTALVHRQSEDGPRAAAELAEAHRRHRAERIARAERERRTLFASSFDDDERAHDPRVLVFLRMAESVLDVRLTAPQFVFGFSAFLSLLVELGILLAFETLTLVIGPALEAQQREAVLSEALIAEIAGSAERDGLRHEEAMERICKAADRITERAEAQSRAPAADGTRRPDPHRAA